MHDTQFSPLALALIAELAKLQSIISSNSDDIGLTSGIKSTALKKPLSFLEPAEDLGEAVERTKTVGNTGDYAAKLECCECTQATPCAITRN